MKKRQSPWGRKPKSDFQWKRPEPAALPLEDRLINGRMLAWLALQTHDQSDRFLNDILADTDSRHSLSGQERGLAVDVASGVVRRRRTIDTLLESQISRPRANVEESLWQLLQIGVYQVVFSRTPTHAAVDTTVEMARTAGCSRWCGFINGVLRNVVRLLSDEIVDQPAANALPLDGGRYRKLNQAVLPDPSAEPAEYTGRAFSLPNSLARRWTDRLAPSDLLTTAFYSLQVPPVCLRVNRLVTTVEQVRAALQSAGVEVVDGHGPWSLKLMHGGRLTDLPGYDEGWWSVQDESAMLAAEMVAPVAGEQILDLCAAPGGKTTHLAELSGDAAGIVACDVSEHRLQRVSDSIRRLKLNSIRTQLIDRDGSGLPSQPFDAVLVDVPCSNTGVLSRRPEARWRFREEELAELVQLQTRLLLTAYEHVRPGGRIVYSTCSIEPEETADLTGRVVGLVPDLSLSQQRLVLPGQVGDGAFQAVLHRRNA
ncbi:MAG: transcription antitermination factor NusB [Fuerstiella sp.]